MRRLILTLSCMGLLGSLLLLGCSETPAPKTPAKSVSVSGTTTAPHRVLAYYFHSTQRCVTCRKIEAYTTEALRTGFPEELKDGRLVFCVLNIDERPNQHFVKDYNLFTKSVILVYESSGEQTAWKNLQKIWELTTDKEKFVRYIQEETRSYLTGKES